MLADALTKALPRQKIKEKKSYGTWVEKHQHLSAAVQEWAW
jgi:hypothetical protein